MALMLMYFTIGVFIGMLLYLQYWMVFNNEPSWAIIDTSYLFEENNRRWRRYYTSKKDFIIECIPFVYFIFVIYWKFLLVKRDFREMK